MPASPRQRARLPSSCSAQASADRSPIDSRGSEAAFEGGTPGAPSRTDDQRFLEKPTQVKHFSPAPGIGSVLLHTQQRFWIPAAECPWRRRYRPAHAVKQVMARSRPGLQVFRSAEPVADPVRELIPRLGTDDEPSTDERRQRWFDVWNFCDVRNVQSP